MSGHLSGFMSHSFPSGAPVFNGLQGYLSFSFPIHVRSFVLGTGHASIQGMNTETTNQGESKMESLQRFKNMHGTVEVVKELNEKGITVKPTMHRGQPHFLYHVYSDGKLVGTYQTAEKALIKADGLIVKACLKSRAWVLSVAKEKVGK